MIDYEYWEELYIEKYVSPHEITYEVTTWNRKLSCVQHRFYYNKYKAMFIHFINKIKYLFYLDYIL